MFVDLAGTLFLTMLERTIEACTKLIMRCGVRRHVNAQQSTMQNNWVDAQAAGQLFLLQELIESL